MFQHSLNKFTIIYTRAQLIQHQISQIPLQYRLPDVIEDDLDVFRVDGGGEVVKEWPLLIPLHPREHGQDEQLNVVY